MKTYLSGFASLLLIATLGLITCKSPVENKTKEITGTKWVEELTIRQLQKDFKDGKYTITDLVRTYLDRIEKIDKNGPHLNSIITINPDALRIAEELDMELSAGKIRGPLHGVPIILKDNIDTHDRMPTTAGATVLSNSFPKTDSFVAEMQGQ
jgi:amidase